MNKSTYFDKVRKDALGSSRRYVNVDRDGEPFGQLWTWPNTETEKHPWHAKPIDGEHKTFGSLEAAKDYMEAV